MTLNATVLQVKLSYEWLIDHRRILSYVLFNKVNGSPFTYMKKQEVLSVPILSHMDKYQQTELTNRHFHNFNKSNIIKINKIQTLDTIYHIKRFQSKAFSKL